MCFHGHHKSLTQTGGSSGHGLISHVCILRDLTVGESDPQKVLGGCLLKTWPEMYLERFGVG